MKTKSTKPTAAPEDETESLKFKNTHLLAVIAELRDKITSLESREQDGSEEINLSQALAQPES